MLLHIKLIVMFDVVCKDVIWIVLDDSVNLFYVVLKESVSFHKLTSFVWTRSLTSE